MASDAMQGRDTGSTGYASAAAHVAKQFAAAGLQPGGHSGGWYQHVPLRRGTHVTPPRISLLLPRRRPMAVSPRDFGLRPSITETSRDFTADLVFVGHGISDRHLGIDEYAGLDIRNKIAIALRGTPTGIPVEIAAHLDTAKPEVAAAKGAAGFAELSFGGFLTYNPAANVARQPVLDWWTPTDVGVTARLRAVLTLSPDASRRIFERAPRSLESVRAATRSPIAGFPLRTRLTIHSRSQWQEFTSPNVIGILAGSDPALADQPVVVAAHLDHLGVDSSHGGDSIFNGAVDNAAGVAMLIEIARSMTARGRPKRPVWFVALTGEERGLLGSDFLAGTTRARIAAMINIDMPLLTYDFSDAVVFGGQHSSLGVTAAKAAKDLGISISADPMPEQNLFIRSDHYRFVVRGVPALFLMTGHGNGGRDAWQRYFAHAYHRPSDEVTARLNWHAGARFADLNARIVRAVAEEPAAPTWNPGNYFGETFRLENSSGRQP